MKDGNSASYGSLSVCSLASGSRGNATYISDGKSAILIDAGLSGVEIERRMASRGLSADDLDAIVISHEHADHVRGAGVLSRRFALPLFITPGTLKAAAPKMGRLAEVRHFRCGEGFGIGDLSLHPFSISHDATDPAGFTIEKNDVKVGIATDLGVATAMVKNHLKQCDMLIIEANHDPVMLQNGPYPWHLKQRIKGRTGHLSNPDSRELLGELIHDRLKHVILGHLSEQNNMPEKALGTVGEAVSGSGLRLSAALQDVCGELIHLQGGEDFSSPAL